jgi:hypothetical protein
MSVGQLVKELENWEKLTITPKLFFRDDDATTEDPKLLKLVDICERMNVPAMLSAIPALADEKLGKVVRESPILTGAVHGYSHKNFSGYGQPQNEFVGTRPLSIMIEELKLGLWICTELFQDSVVPIFVPPWHNIDGTLLNHVLEIGYSGISVFGFNQHSSSSIPEINTHVDLMEWSDKEKMRGINDIIASIGNSLSIARKLDMRYIGIMSHHRYYTDLEFTIMEEIFKICTDLKLEWVSFDEIISNKYYCFSSDTGGVSPNG